MNASRNRRRRNRKTPCRSPGRRWRGSRSRPRSTSSESTSRGQALSEVNPALHKKLRLGPDWRVVDERGNGDCLWYSVAAALRWPRPAGESEDEIKKDITRVRSLVAQYIRDNPDDFDHIKNEYLASVKGYDPRLTRIYSNATSPTMLADRVMKRTHWGTTQDIEILSHAARHIGVNFVILNLNYKKGETPGVYCAKHNPEIKCCVILAFVGPAAAGHFVFLVRGSKAVFRQSELPRGLRKEQTDTCPSR